MSESSKKEKSLYSVGGGQISPNISQDGEKIMRCEDDKRDTESIGEAFSTTQDSDCSYSSFYSFLETDKSDASMNSSPEYASANPVNQAEVSTNRVEMWKRSISFILFIA